MKKDYETQGIPSSETILAFWESQKKKKREKDRKLFKEMVAAAAAAAAAKLLQSCPTLSDPMDGSPPGSPVPGILQARTLEWVASFFSNA